MSGHSFNFSAATWNCNGLSAYAYSQARSRKGANASSLFKGHDIVCLQETHLNPKESRYLHRLSPSRGSKVFYSNLKTNAGGVATYICDKISKSHIIDNISLPPPCNGRALLTRVYDPHSHNISFIINLHLLWDGNHTTATSILKLISARITEADYVYLLGDFNFVQDRHKDRSCADGPSPPSSFLTAWQRFTSTHLLTEIHQPSHTHFSSTHVDTANTSRIDRIYTSHTEAERGAYRPFSYLSHVPNTLLTSTGKGGDRSPGISDHVPVSLAFPPPLDDKKRSPTIPRWAADDDQFSDCFESEWLAAAYKLSPDPDPFEVLRLFKTCLFAASRTVIELQKAKRKKVVSDLGRFAKLVKAMRLTQDGGDMAKFYSDNPELKGLGPESLRAEADALLHTALPERKVQKPGKRSASKPNLLTKLKLILPSTMQRLQALRPDMHSPPTSDPDAMARIAALFWSSVWAPRANTDEQIEPESYYGFYQKEIPPSLVPIIPSASNLFDAIMQTNNSSPGPDGIPFAAWRAVAKHAAPVLHAVLLALARGQLPPAGYNYGLLFLIPKKGTLLPKDTRPISVTNADNRIVAKAIVEAIIPAVCAVLQNSQKGFIKGRFFEEHIRALNEKFYEIAESDEAGENLFILFMDTAKAFDSIDHAFIVTALRRTGFPSWLITVVEGLLHLVKVKPTFRSSKEYWIEIWRGVKQGCPLSPILFVICYDILLERISRLPNVEPHACADDLAISTSDVTNFWQPMLLINDFRFASGLGVNVDKTEIVAARDCEVADLLASSPWPDIKMALFYKYLGILIGRDVTVSDIYKKPLTDLEERATLYYPTLKSVSHSGRVLGFNVFLFSKLSYIMNFYNIPYDDEHKAVSIVHRVQAVARKAILRYGMGTDYPYCHLLSPLDRVSPGKPVRDAWAVSVSTLAAQANLMDWNGQSVVEVDYTHTMIMSKHVHNAAAEFVCYALASLPDGTPFDAEEHVRPSLRATRSHMYDILIHNGYGDEADADIALKLELRGLDEPDLVPTLHHNFAIIHTLPDHHRSVQFNILFNALPTLRRVMPIVIKDKITRAYALCHPCFLCGRDTDSIEHLYGGDCQVVSRAMEAAAHTLNQHREDSDPFPVIPSLSPLDLGAPHPWAVSLLAFPYPDNSIDPATREVAVKACALFNSVVWYERRYYFESLACPLSLPKAVNRLTYALFCSWRLLFRSPRTKGLGSAGRRSEAQQLEAQAYGQKLLAAVPPSSLIAFTDGSASPNPGPCGGGAFLSDTSKEWCDEAVAALGQGTNNIGELWAIGMALELAEERLNRFSYTYLYIFTDSQYSIGVLTLGWKVKGDDRLVKAIKSKIDSLATRIVIIIDWIPAHVGIADNEHADHLAGAGSKRSALNRINVNVPEALREGHFLPP